jgi:hypothetical protein
MGWTCVLLTSIFVLGLIVVGGADRTFKTKPSKLRRQFSSEPAGQERFKKKLIRQPQVSRGHARSLRTGYAV